MDIERELNSIIQPNEESTMKQKLVASQEISSIHLKNSDQNISKTMQAIN